MKVAAVQLNHLPGRKDENFRKIESFTRKAAEAGNELVVFPEMCISGYWHVRKLNREEVADLAEAVPGGEYSSRLIELAAEHNITIGAGLIEAGDDGQFYNTYLVAMPDGRWVRHRKLHCFISEYLSSGNEFTVFELPNGIKAGILICYDNNIIENVRITALMGADILLAPHQTGGCVSPSPLCMGGIDPGLWDERAKFRKELEAEFKGPKGREWLLKWLPARAHDNGLFLLFSNGVGRDDDEVRTGNSMIIDPYGNILTETWEAEEKMVSADLDMSLLEKSTGRRWIRSRRPDLYKSLTVPSGREEDTRKVRFDYK